MSLTCANGTAAKAGLFRFQKMKIVIYRWAGITTYDFPKAFTLVFLLDVNRICLLCHPSAFDRTFYVGPVPKKGCLLSQDFALKAHWLLLVVGLVLRLLSRLEFRNRWCQLSALSWLFWHLSSFRGHLELWRQLSSLYHVSRLFS